LPLCHARSAVEGAVSLQCPSLCYVSCMQLHAYWSLLNLQVLPRASDEVLQEPSAARIMRLYWQPAALIFASSHMLATACAVTGKACLRNVCGASWSKLPPCQWQCAFMLWWNIRYAPAAGACRCCCYTALDAAHRRRSGWWSVRRCVGKHCCIRHTVLPNPLWHSGLITVACAWCSTEPLWHGAFLAGAQRTAACRDYWQHQGHRQGTCPRVPAVCFWPSR
jgi:hypothetical protein